MGSINPNLLSQIGAQARYARELQQKLANGELTGNSEQNTSTQTPTTTPTTGAPAFDPSQFYSMFFQMQQMMQQMMMLMMMNGMMGGGIGGTMPGFPFPFPTFPGMPGNPTDPTQNKGAAAAKELITSLIMDSDPNKQTFAVTYSLSDEDLQTIRDAIAAGEITKKDVSLALASLLAEGANEPLLKKELIKLLNSNVVNLSTFLEDVILEPLPANVLPDLVETIASKGLVTTQGEANQALIDKLFNLSQSSIPQAQKFLDLLMKKYEMLYGAQPDSPNGKALAELKKALAASGTDDVDDSDKPADNDKQQQFDQLLIQLATMDPESPEAVQILSRLEALAKDLGPELALQVKVIRLEHQMVTTESLIDELDHTLITLAPGSQEHTALKKRIDDLKAELAKLEQELETAENEAT